MSDSVAMKLVRNKIYGSVHRAVFSFFDELIKKYKDECASSEYKCDNKKKKVMRNFQKTLEDIIKNRGDYHKQFLKHFETQSPYIGKLLHQDMKYKINLLSKLRTSKENTIEISPPNLEEFSFNILTAASTSIFPPEQIEKYYTQVKTKVDFRQMLDDITTTTLDLLLSDVFVRFFDCDDVDNKLNSAIEKSMHTANVNNNKTISLTKDDFSDKSSNLGENTGMFNSNDKENIPPSFEKYEGIKESIGESYDKYDKDRERLDDRQHPQKSADNSEANSEHSSYSEKDISPKKETVDTDTEKLLEVLKGYVNIQKKRGDYDLVSEITENY